MLGCAVLLCLAVCLTLLASFFLPSHLSLKHAHTTTPVGTDGGVVGNLVVVHSRLTLLNEAGLLAVGPDARSSSDGLLEVRVYRRTCDRLETLQLTRSGHVEPLCIGREWENIIVVKTEKYVATGFLYIHVTTKVCDYYIQNCKCVQN